MSKQRFSIIIPAHNEEAMIFICLQKLVQTSSVVVSSEIIVVCNGCSDKTADIVRSFDVAVVCIETEVASKTNALNLGDNIASYFPRIYLDADVLIDFKAVHSMCEILENPGFFATSLEAKMDLSNSSWFVRAFYDIWLTLPYCKAGMIGSGVYALSEEGRARFDTFPDVIADDGYVRCLFKENERVITTGHYAIVTAPKDLFSLIKIKTRSRLGRYQLKDKFPALLANESKDYKEGFKGLILNLRLWPNLIVYISVNIISRIRARYQYLTKQTKWERDESSRS